MSHGSDFGAGCVEREKDLTPFCQAGPNNGDFLQKNLTNHTAFELLICRDHRDTKAKSRIFFHASRIWNLQVFGTKISPKVNGSIWALMAAINFARFANFYILPTVTEKMKTLSGLTLWSSEKWRFFFWNSDPFLIGRKGEFFSNNSPKRRGRLPKWWCSFKTFFEGVDVGLNLLSFSWVFFGKFWEASFRTA